jgi:hypothetical protein
MPGIILIMLLFATTSMVEGRITTGVDFINNLRAAFLCKTFSKKFCAYILNLYFFGAIILAQKMLKKCW